MTDRAAFFDLRSELESIKQDLEKLNESTEVLDTNLTELDFEDGYGVSSPLHDIHRSSARDLLEWYKDKHPRRRKIPIGRIFEEYPDADPVEGFKQTHNSYYKDQTSRIREIKSRQRDLIPGIDIREVDDPTEFKRWTTEGYVADGRLHRDASYTFEIATHAAFQALWLNRHVKAQWWANDGEGGVRTYVHPDDEPIVERLGLCSSGEPFLLFWLQWKHRPDTGRVGRPEVTRGSIPVLDSARKVILEEADEHPDFKSNHHISYGPRSHVPDGHIDEFLEAREYGPPGQNDDRWFTNDPFTHRAST